MNTYRINPLIQFDTIFDTDVGIIKYFMSKCGIKANDSEILSLAYSRSSLNPLSSLTEYDIDNIDEIYNTIKTECKEEYLIFSPATDFANVVGAMCSLEAAYPTILVRDELEYKCAEELKNLTPTTKAKISIVQNNNLETLNGAYDPYYIYHYTDLYDESLSDKFYTSHVYRKNIYFADFKFNIDFLSAYDFGKLSNENQFVTISLWRKNEA